MASLSALSPVNYIGLYLGYGFTGLVNWFFEPSQLHRVISGLWFHSVSLCFEPSQRHRVISGLWLHWGNSCCLHPWGKFGLAVVIVFVCWYVWWFVCVTGVGCALCLWQASHQGELSCVREVRCAVFSFIHQAFIQEPHLAKLIHFQVNTPLVHPPCQTCTLPGNHTSCTPALSDLYTAR